MVGSKLETQAGFRTQNAAALDVGDMASISFQSNREATFRIYSNLTQWKRAGLITLKSLDRNQELLFCYPPFLLLFWLMLITGCA